MLVWKWLRFSGQLVTTARIPCNHPSARAQDAERQLPQCPFPSDKALCICNYLAPNPAVLPADINSKSTHQGALGIELAHVAVPNQRAIWALRDYHCVIGLGILDPGVDFGEIDQLEAGIVHFREDFGSGVVAEGRVDQIHKRGRVFGGRQAGREAWIHGLDGKAKTTDCPSLEWVGV